MWKFFLFLLALINILRSRGNLFSCGRRYRVYGNAVQMNCNFYLLLRGCSRAIMKISEINIAIVKMSWIMIIEIWLMVLVGADVLARRWHMNFGWNHWTLSFSKCHELLAGKMSDIMFWEMLVAVAAEMLANNLRKKDDNCLRNV